ncbi:spaetzle-processing enzyme [Nilaparvata lugens]|uniref:spaetzle-processing enzyme n=1 Tax=Nilaparvata lugens TaxID=108931 RepID=UPI00193CB188|nr:spaetzle-processing enzyme [Nilaparvata lugens]
MFSPLSLGSLLFTALIVYQYSLASCNATFALSLGIGKQPTKQRLKKALDPTKHRHWALVNNNGFCGISHSQRIIGGVDAGIGKYPWIVRLAFQIPTNQGDRTILKCAGSIITKKYVVTANHCFTPYDKLSFVRAGEYDERTDPDCEQSNPDDCAPEFIDYRVQKVINHKDYKEGVSFVNDITLVKIKGQFEFNEYIMPICLEYGSLLGKNYIGSNVEVAGWGIFDIVKEEVHPVLQRVTIPVINSEVCRDRMKKATYVEPSKQICAGGVIGKDSCGGDSGGPLMSAQVTDGRPPRYFLIGVVSFGLKECGKTDMPAVYTRVYAYLSWILDNIDK